MPPDEQNQQYQQGQSSSQEDDDLYINPNGTLYQNEQDPNSGNVLGQPSDNGYAQDTLTNPSTTNYSESEIANPQTYYDNTGYSQNPSSYSAYTQSSPSFVDNSGTTPGGVIHPQENSSNSRSSYDWITNYQASGQTAQVQQGSSKKKVFVFIFIAMLLIALVAIIGFAIFSKPENNNLNTGLEDQTENIAVQNNDYSNTETQPDQESEQNSTVPVPTPIEQPTPTPQPSTPTPPPTPPPSQTNEQLDNLRKQKLRAISQKLTDYFNAYGQYPSYAQATDENWLNSMSIKKEDLIDPGGTDWRVKNTPTKNYFAYQPRPTNCNNTNIICTTYTLSAVLSSGLIFQLYLID